VRITTRIVLIWSGLLLTLLLAEVAFACPVCGFGQDKARGAFIATTVIMTFIPLTMIGGLLVWLRQRSLRAARDETKVLVDC
jgi:hypothetical protein